MHTLFHLICTYTSHIHIAYTHGIYPRGYVYVCGMNVCMGWLRSVGSIKLQVSFAEYRLFYRALLQKRPIILSILLTVATPYIHPTHTNPIRVFVSCVHIHPVYIPYVHIHPAHTPWAGSLLQQWVRAYPLAPLHSIAAHLIDRGHGEGGGEREKDSVWVREREGERGGEGMGEREGGRERERVRER